MTTHLRNPESELQMRQPQFSDRLCNVTADSFN